MSLTTQFTTVWMMVLCGMAIGAAFDIHKIIARSFRFPRWLISTIDFMIWIAAAVFVFVMLFHVNNGQVRIYVFLAILLGVSIYFVLLSRLIEWMVVKLIAILRYIYGIIYKLVKVFIGYPLIWVYMLIKIILGALLVLAIFVYNFMVKLLLSLWKMLRRLF